MDLTTLTSFADFTTADLLALLGTVVAIGTAVMATGNGIMVALRRGAALTPTPADDAFVEACGSKWSAIHNGIAHVLRFVRFFSIPNPAKANPTESR